MMTQEQKMKTAIAVGIIALLAVAFIVTREGGDGPDVTGRDDRMEGSVKPEDGPGNGEGTGAGAGAGTGSEVARRSTTFALAASSSAGQSGTVTLIDLGENNTQVIIALVNSNKDDTQPANIHAGTCKDLAKETQYALNPVVKGRSVTTLNVSIGALLDAAPQSVRVRTDAVTPNAPLAACGNLR